MSDKELFQKAYELCEDREMAKRMVAEIKRRMKQKKSS